jgi:hypothetical protein
MIENFESRKQKYFFELLYCTGDWVSCIEEQLKKYFTDYEAIFYVKYIQQHLKPDFIKMFLTDVADDPTLFDEIELGDMEDGIALANINAHIRFIYKVKSNIENSEELLASKIKEISDYLALKEKAERQKKKSEKYEYLSLKLKLKLSKFSDISHELYMNMIDSKLIPESTKKADFIRIFNGVKTDIRIENRVVWSSTNSALRYFINQLIELDCIEEIPDSIKWTIVCNCFCDENKLPYTNDQLRNNTKIHDSKIIGSIDAVIKSYLDEVNN